MTRIFAAPSAQLASFALAPTGAIAIGSLSLFLTTVHHPIHHLRQSNYNAIRPCLPLFFFFFFSVARPCA
ncbi:hypothetical protein B0H10DRAFT_1990861, partial [Mycena sp. CBHHK59/15]